MLRCVIIGYGLLSLIGAAMLLFLVHATLWLVLYLAVNGFILVSAVPLERKRYRTRVDRTQGHWQPTGERFVDPTTQRLMEVLYYSATGERDYREATRPNEGCFPHARQEVASDVVHFLAGQVGVGCHLFTFFQEITGIIPGVKLPHAVWYNIS